MAERPIRVSIGFHGGQVLGAKLAPESFDRLHAALGGDGWIDVEAEDGVAHLNLGEIVYLLVDSDEHRVGFSGS